MWLEAGVAERLRPTTLKSRRERIAAVLPFIGDRPVRSIGELDIARVKRELAWYAPATLNVTLVALGGVLRYAAGIGVRDAAPRIKLIKVPDDDAPACWQPADFERIVNAAGELGHLELLVVLLGGEAGLRHGEMLGLQAGDLALRRREIRVARSVTIVPGGDRIVGPPKNGKARVIPISRRLADVLRPIVEGAGGRVEQFVLVKPTGEPATTHTLSGALHHALERAGLPLASLHKLRHPCLSHLLAGGADLRTVQAIAGHKSITSTMRYLHAVGGMARAAVDRLATLRAEAEAEEVSAGGTDLTRAPATRRRGRKLPVV